MLEQAGSEPVVVLNHNRPAAYLLSAATYEVLLERLDDLDLAEIVKFRRTEPTVEITLDAF